MLCEWANVEIRKVDSRYVTTTTFSCTDATVYEIVDDDGLSEFLCAKHWKEMYRIIDLPALLYYFEENTIDNWDNEGGFVL